MKAQVKIILLNKMSEALREIMSTLSKLFEDDNDISHYIWKINKSISDMERAICINLEKHVTKEQFDDIVKDIKDFGNDG